MSLPLVIEFYQPDQLPLVGHQLELLGVLPLLSLLLLMLSLVKLDQD